MDHSKAFDCIPHDLLIAKLHTYGFFYSHLKRRKQNVKINNTYSFFKELLSGVLQDSILGPICFFGQALLICIILLTTTLFQLFLKIYKN